MREVFGRMKDGEGNESSVGCTGLVGALEGAVEASLEAADALRFEKNFSSRSRPLAMVIVLMWRRMLEACKLDIRKVSCRCATQGRDLKQLTRERGCAVDERPTVMM